MPSDIQIRYDLGLSEPEESLLLDSLRSIAPEARQPRIALLGRFGFSGAKLLRIAFDDGSPDLSFVAKLHRDTEIRAEVEAAAAVTHVFEDSAPTTAPRFADGIGALIYRYRGRGSTPLTEPPIELKSVNSSPHYKRVLDDLYAGICKAAHTTPRHETKSLISAYSRYLRGHKSRTVIQKMLGKQREKRNVSYYGATFPNPVKLLRHEKWKERRRLRFGPVHGDLHPSNVIVSGNGEARLVDFAWASSSGHYLSDFVLMESSIRFMNARADVPFEERRRLDELLLERESAQGVAKELSSAELKRIAGAVSVVRKHAKNAGGEDFSFSEYVAAQYLVLYGLLKYPGYQSDAAVRALGLSAKFLTREFGQSPP